MKSFANFSPVTKERSELNADKVNESHRDEDLNFQPPLDVRQWITRRITNFPTDFYSDQLLSYSPLKTAHFPQFIRFYGPSA